MELKIKARSMDPKMWFFDRQRVIDSLSKAKRSRLAKQGAIVRTIARRSIRNPKRIKLGDLPEDARTAFEVRARLALQDGRPKPQLPFASSKPGEPPRNQTGLLKDHIIFAYDPNSESMIVGPETLNGSTDAPNRLEFGGHNDRGVFIEPRPYMRPAFQKSIHSYPSVFKDSME